MKPFSLLLCRHGYGDPLHLAGFTLKNEIEFCLFLCKELDANTPERKHPPPPQKNKKHTHKKKHALSNSGNCKVNNEKSSFIRLRAPFLFLKYRVWLSGGVNEEIPSHLLKLYLKVKQLLLVIGHMKTFLRRCLKALPHHHPPLTLTE